MSSTRWLTFPLLVALALALGTLAVSAQNVTSTGSQSFSATPVSTTVPSPTGSLDAPIPGQGQYPALQPWCNGGMNDTFCPSVLLQDAELSGIFADSKTFVDKPTNGSLNSTLQAFAALGNNLTVGQMETFVEKYFKGEGLELSQVPLQGFNANPAILDGISDPLYKGWVSIVNSYWTLLIRETNQSAICQDGGCESSLIPMNHTLVVPGGRYREIYYWDSRWILEGLLQSELYTYAWDMLQNFMDFIETYGFIPNGGRKYYLNRSQPPMFVQMIDAYIKVTGNVTLLERALPLAEQELTWWSTNRTINVTSPYTGAVHSVYNFNVTNSAPRPEGYVEDFTTAFNASPALSQSQRETLFAELASGAETGWDYSSRWCKAPLQKNISDNYPALRTLNTRAIVPVDLNALLAGDHALLADLYELWQNSSSSSSSQGSGAWSSNSSSTVSYHREIARNLSDAVLDLFWDPAKSWFYDFNTTANARSDIYHPGGTYPLWQNITPPELIGNETAALKVVSGARYLLGKYTGVPSVASLLLTGLQWDFPNSWPPHLYTSIKAFEQLGRVNPNAQVFDNLTITFDQVAPNQFGLNETGLQPQPASTLGNVSLEVAEAKGKPWPQALSIEYANRYMQAAFCTWYSTGGEIADLLVQLPLSDLNATGTYTAGEAGVMFEKFNITDTDAAGGGGEYTVQVGFGWTNGVVLWLANEFGSYLPMPTCPLIPIIETTANGNSSVYQNGTSVPYSSGSNGSTNATMANQAVLFQGYRVPRD
ncbi:hypothetical protein JCM24511_08561 [Saitozyma sp. JCM 24511]|nr:hypothetical protein JCM24511_08561 [Saitozyma sp. JCM 24511]